jgi:hypothetical protein
MPSDSLSDASDQRLPGGSWSVTIISSRALNAWSERLIRAAGDPGLAFCMLA